MVAGDPSTDLSVVIVNYNVKHFAEQCLRSVIAAQGDISVEIFVVDNASSDNSLEYLRPLFPSVTFIANTENLGFARANNPALRLACGRYLMILNPDTLVGEGALKALIDYMDSHPRAGAAGPKFLNRYGQFDKSSKRGLPTPWVAFCRISGLSALFPRSPLFSRYDLLYIDEDVSTTVDVLGGACMIVRREAFEQVGGLDETFFMFGEDIDWSYRIKLAGWEVHYAPVAKIVHFKGESTRRSGIDRERAFYGAMHLFLEKHFRSRYPFLGHKLIDVGIVIAEVLGRVSKLKRRFIWQASDFSAILGALLIGRWLRWGDFALSPSVFGSLFFQALVTVLCLVGVGAYSRRRGQISALFAGVLLAFFINSSFTYFFKNISYSRFVSLFGHVGGGVALWGWRQLLSLLRNTASYRRFYQRPTLIVGLGEAARKVLRELRQNPGSHYRIIGLVDPEDIHAGTIVEGCPVLGSEEELPRLIDSEEVEEILFAYDKTDYNRVLSQIARFGDRRVGFKVIDANSVSAQNFSNPFLSVDYIFPRRVGRSLRRLATLLSGR